MPRLIQRQQPRRSTGPGPGPGPGSSARTIEPTRLPRYEPPQHPLTEDSHRRLNDMALHVQTHKHRHHLDRSVRILSDSAAHVNEVLADVRNNLHEVQRRRAAKSREAGEGEEIAPSEREARMQEVVEAREGEVRRMTERIEGMVREVVDGKEELVDCEAAVAAAAGRAGRRLEAYNAERVRVEAERAVERRRKRQRREAQRQEEEEEEQEEEEQEEEEAAVEVVEGEDMVGVTPLAAFREARENQRREYQGRSAVDRYGDHNDYVAFRKLVHDAQQPEEGRPVPPARLWFDAEGRPAHLFWTGEEDGGEAEQEDEGDDEVVVAREVRDWRCPLSMHTMKEPVSSTKCIHAFEKEAFELYMRQNRGSATCPVSGCQQILTKKDVRDDPVLKRKIIRAQRAAQQQEDADETRPLGSNASDEESE